MGKMSELSLLVKELNQCGETLIVISQSLSSMFSSSDEPPETPAPEEKTITLEEVRAVLAEKSRDGHTAKIRELLQKYGADKLSEINASDYPALLAEAEVLGNG
jgi:predicted Zn-dependent peptidase